MLIVCPNSGIDIQYKLDDFSNHNRVTNIIKQPGGKGFNVLRVLKQLGEDAELVTFTGKYNGQYIKDKAIEEELNISAIDIKEDNRICLNIIGSNSFEILESGPTIFEDEISAYVEEIVSKSSTHDFVLFSGSEPKAAKAIYKSILAEVNCKVIVDASRDSLFNCYNSNVFGLKINNFEFEELCDFLNVDGNMEEQILKFKNDLVIVTLGADGSFVKYYDELYRVVIPNYDIINTTGSGDSFFAGLCFGLSKNYNITDVLKLANACGILNALEEKTGYINKVKLEEIISTINIKKLR